MEGERGEWDVTSAGTGRAATGALPTAIGAHAMARAVRLGRVPHVPPPPPRRRCFVARHLHARCVPGCPRRGARGRFGGDPRECSPVRVPVRCDGRGLRRGARAAGVGRPRRGLCRGRDVRELFRHVMVAGRRSGSDRREGRLRRAARRDDMGAEPRPASRRRSSERTGNGGAGAPRAGHGGAAVVRVGHRRRRRGVARPGEPSPHRPGRIRRPCDPAARGAAGRDDACVMQWRGRRYLGCHAGLRGDPGVHRGGPTRRRRRAAGGDLPDHERDPHRQADHRQDGRNGRRRRLPRRWGSSLRGPPGRREPERRARVSQARSDPPREARASRARRQSRRSPREHRGLAVRRGQHRDGLQCLERRVRLVLVRRERLDSRRVGRASSGVETTRGSSAAPSATTENTRATSCGPTA